MTIYYIGTSGWHYDHWKGLFYPEEFSSKRWLEYYNTQFNTVEINNSFYRLPAENAFKQWHDETSADFKFALKASRVITHIKRLKDCDRYLENLLIRAKLLKDKLAVLLFQLPPQMKVNIGRLDSFLGTLPPGLRTAFEFRNQSWMDKSVYAILEKHNAGFCVYDLPGYASPAIGTADFTYVRFHGNRDLYYSSYSDSELQDRALEIQKLAANLKQCFIYFNNDAGASATANASTLRTFLENSING
jgi:uncharacterized protein YecE (DUF72 family)